MKQQNKLSTRREQELTAQSETVQSAHSKPLEFESPEDLLRFDAGTVAVPDAVADRLQRSLGEAAAPRTSWWRRLFKSGADDSRKSKQ